MLGLPQILKLETLHYLMPSSWKSIGPISLQGAVSGTQGAKQGPIVSLVVKPKQSYGANAEIHPSFIAEMIALEQPHAHETSGPILVMLASGSDVVLTVRSNDALPPGIIAMDEAQRLSLHVLPGDNHRFTLFSPSPEEPHELVELSAEVHILSSHHNQYKTGLDAVVDASHLTREIIRVNFSRWLCVNEWVVIPNLNGLDLVVRVTEVHTLDRQEREEAIGYHCFRGSLTSTTRIFLQPRSHAEDKNDTHNQKEGTEEARLPTTVEAEGMMHSLSLAGSITRGSPDNVSDGNEAHRQGGDVRLKLVNVLLPPPIHQNPDIVNVVTNDEEFFPVKKKLLRSCLALTKVVRDSSSALNPPSPSPQAHQPPSVQVDIDCLTFDRVLLFLEAHILNKTIPAWSLHLIDDLLVAGENLSCKPLVDHCKERLGSKGQLLIYSLEEIIKANASGEVLLILDGMVLDVKAWLPEHPGGSTIIPTQSLNCDCARFFEVYHASRESFLYLRDFYAGEVRPEDRNSVQLGGGGEPPSLDFLVQLREYSDGFRIKLGPNDTVLHGTGKDRFKSF